MLNKNQSKKRNLWKYCVVIPALVGFVVLFQVEVVAKEKQQVLKENSGNSKPLKVYKITKKTTDADLNLIKESLKKDHDIDFKISEVKRNSDNNLTSLKLNIKSGEHQSQSIQTGGDHPIKDFGVVVTTENDGSKKVGFQIADETNKNSKNTTEKKQKIKLKTNDNTNSDISTETSTNNNNDVATTIITGSDNKTTTKIITKQGNSQIIVSNSGKSNSNGKRLVIVDGVEMPADFDFDDFKSGDIKTINVLKGDMATDEYGDKGKDGVIVIETRK